MFYRKDIDGLRAISVLAVLGYHAFPNRLPGGFVGVDFFFIISGFLISTIIMKNLNSGTFSYLDFYSRRIKRIFPALLIVLFSTLLMGWFFQTDLLGLAFNQLGKNIAAATVFISNFTQWNEAGYFNNSSYTKPLLHLWSLAIEEQFYIVWPVMLGIIWKFRYRFLPIVFTLLVISFSTNIYYIYNNTDAAFFSPLSRFWEMMLGGLLAYFKAKQSETLNKYKNWQSVFGLSLIFACILAFNKEIAFPGWYALAPCAGAFLIISAGPDAFLNRTFLSNKVLVFIGLISYPLYLWHWPALYLYNNFDLHIPFSSFVNRMLILIVCLVLSWLTYKLIETPIRHHADQMILKILCLLMTLMGIIGFIVYKTGLASFRLSEQHYKSYQQLMKVVELKDMEKLYGKKSCFIQDQNTSLEILVENNCFTIKFSESPIVFLIGDSHSASLSLGLRPYLENHNINFMQVSSGGCVPAANNMKNAFCQKVNSIMLKMIAQVKPEVVLIDANWTGASQPAFYTEGNATYEELLLKRIREFQKNGAREVVVVGQIPTWKNSLPRQIFNNFVLKNISIPKRTFIGAEQESLDNDLKMKRLNYPQGVKYFSTKDALCNDKGCLMTLGDNLEVDIVVWDYGHLTVAGATYLTDKIFKSDLIQSDKIKKHLK